MVIIAIVAGTKNEEYAWPGFTKRVLLITSLTGSCVWPKKIASSFFDGKSLNNSL